MTKHLKILGKANPELLEDAKYIKKLIIDLIDLVGMEIMGEPMVYTVPIDETKLNSEVFLDTGGTSVQVIGFATLTTSHVAIHGWPLTNEFHLDLYSCREFEKQKVIGFLADALQITKIQVADLTEHCEWKD